MSDRSKGSKLGAMASAVIIIAFFLPWVRACNRELSGFEIATNSEVHVEGAWFYWLALAAPILCLILFFRKTDAAHRIGVAVTRLVAALIGFLPLLNIWYNAQQRGGALDILYGGWMTISGYAGLALSFFLDLSPPQPRTGPPNPEHGAIQTSSEQTTVFCPGCGAENQRRNKFCLKCGKPLPSRTPASGRTSNTLR